MNAMKVTSTRSVATCVIVLLLLLSVGGCGNVSAPPGPPPVATKAPNTPSADPAPLSSTSNAERWQAASATLAGTALPSSFTNSITLVIAGENYEVNAGGKLDKGKCAIDRTITPNRMMITGTDGPNAGKTMLAIFDFPDAAQMRVCYDLNGAAYPPSFESTADNGLFLVTYTRTN